MTQPNQSALAKAVANVKAHQDAMRAEAARLAAERRQQQQPNGGQGQ